MYSFPKSDRLIKATDYRYVFEKANRINCSPFIVLHRDSCQSQSRLGLAISKKKVAKAIQRNRIKRLVRESFRQHSLPAVDLVFMVHQDAGTLTNRALYKKLGKVWSQLEDYYAR